MKSGISANTVPWDGICYQHRKRLYRSRKHARRAARRLHDPGMQAYRCHALTGRWHYGHTPPDVKAGLCTKAEYYAAIARQHQARDEAP